MIEIPISVGGWYELEKNGELVASFPNIITDVGLDALASNAEDASLLNLCGLGAGTTPPEYADTALESPLISTAMTSFIGGVVSSSTPYGQYSQTDYTLAGRSGDFSYSEIGIITRSGALFSRSLIKDMLGNPTSLFVAAGETLKIRYRLYKYPPPDDVIATNHLVERRSGNTTHTVTIRPYGILEPSHPTSYWNGAARMSPSTATASTSNTPVQVTTIGEIAGSVDGSVVLQPYTAGSYERVVSAVISGSAISSIGSILLGGSNKKSGWRCYFSPPIPMATSATLTTTVKIKWMRY